MVVWASWRRLPSRSAPLLVEKRAETLKFQVISRPHDRQEDGKLADLALVSGSAVFSTSKKGLEGCIFKPQSRKSLKTKDHIAKVREGGKVWLLRKRDD